MSTPTCAARPALKFVRLPRAPILSQLQLDEALLRASALNWCVVNAAPADQRAVVLGCGGQVGKLVQAPACVADGVPLVRRCGAEACDVHCSVIAVATIITNVSEISCQQCISISDFVRPIIRLPPDCRFSGGGTVFIGAHTCFVSLIGNAGHLRAPPLPTRASDANAPAVADATAAAGSAAAVPPGVQCYPRPLMDWSGHLYDRVFRRANHASGARAQHIVSRFGHCPSQLCA
jgi:hypothetical protein